MDNKDNNDPLLERAKTVLADGDLGYAVFLYREILKKYPEDVKIRQELHKLRKSVQSQSKNIFFFLKKVFTLIQLFVLQKRKFSASQIIDKIEELIDYDPTNLSGYRKIASIAKGAKMYNLLEFTINEIPIEERTYEDNILLARAFLEQKKFNQSLKVANLILENDPDNEEAKDIVWQSSVDKSMNKNLDLVMAGGLKKFSPPKVDASQIVLSNPQKRDDDDGKKDKDGKSKKQTRNELFK